MEHMTIYITFDTIKQMFYGQSTIKIYSRGSHFHTEVAILRRAGTSRY